MFKIISGTEYRATNELIYKLEIDNENLEGVNKLLNERIKILEDRNNDLIKENTRLKKEVNHE